MSLDSSAFITFVDESRRTIDGVYTALEEVSQATTAQHETLKESRRRMVESVSELIERHLDKLPEATRSAIQASIDTAKAALDREITQTEERLAANEEELTTLEQERMRLTGEIKLVNPVMDEREEALKVRVKATKERIATLKETLGAKIGFVRWIFRLAEITSLREQIAAQYGSLERDSKELYDLRQEWEEAARTHEVDQERIGTRWEETKVARAELMRHQQLLSKDPRALAVSRGLAAYLGTLGGDGGLPEVGFPGASGDMANQLGRLVDMNDMLGSYRDGMIAIVETLGFLRGITEGLERFSKSLEDLAQQERTYPTLPALTFELDAEVSSYHDGWQALAAALEDEDHLAMHPKAVMDILAPLLEGKIRKEAIEAMFQGLGRAIEQATEGWQG